MFDGDGDEEEPRDRIDDTESLDDGLGKRVFIGCALLKEFVLLVLDLPLLLFLLLSVNVFSLGDEPSREFGRFEKADFVELSPRALKRFIIVSDVII